MDKKQDLVDELHSQKTQDIKIIPESQKPSIRVVWLAAVNEISSAPNADEVIKKLSDVFKITPQEIQELKRDAAKPKTSDKCQQMMRLLVNGKYLCPTGFADTGRTWGDVDGDIQCTKGKCLALRPNKCDYTLRLNKNGQWACPTGYTDTGRNWDTTDPQKQCQIGSCKELPTLRKVDPTKCPEFQMYDKSQKKCVCDHTQFVAWNEITKRCECDPKQIVTWNNKKHTCECDPTQGVTWNKNERKCTCDYKAGFEWNGKRCVKTALASGNVTGGQVATPANVGTLVGNFVVTWYSADDNTPPYSNVSSLGKYLTPFISIAVPFTQLKRKGGTLDYGDILYVKSLDGRTMPNGKKHNGLVRIDDFCGDNNRDGYCHQNYKGKRYPNIDVYIGDMKASGHTCRSGGPAGSGADFTQVYKASGVLGSWGGKSKGTGRCGDIQTARREGCGYMTWDEGPENWWPSTCRTVAAYRE